MIDDINDLKTGHAEIKIKVMEGFKINSEAKGNGFGMLLAVVSLVTLMSRESGIPTENILEDAKDVMQRTKCIGCESVEQRDVLEQMIKNKMFPGVEE